MTQLGIEIRLPEKHLVKQAYESLNVVLTLTCTHNLMSIALFALVYPGYFVSSSLSREVLMKPFTESSRPFITFFAFSVPSALANVIPVAAPATAANITRFFITNEPIIFFIELFFPFFPMIFDVKMLVFAQTVRKI